MSVSPGAIGKRRGFWRKEQFGAGRHDLCDELPKSSPLAPMRTLGLAFGGKGVRAIIATSAEAVPAAQHKACEIKVGSAYVGGVGNGDGIRPARRISRPYETPTAASSGVSAADDVNSPNPKATSATPKEASSENVVQAWSTACVAY